MKKHFRPVNKKYLDKVSSKRVSTRVWYFEEAFNRIKPNKPWAESLQISRAILFTIARSYFYDIERLKDFHDIKYAEKYKIAAYTAKWILKHRPVYFSVNDPAEITTSQIFYFNERFALQIACTIAEIPASVITKQFLEDAYYTFHYRNVSEEMLILWLKSLGGTSDVATG